MGIDRSQLIVASGIFNLIDVQLAMKLFTKLCLVSSLISDIITNL